MELVAFSLEEPPAFATQDMGSAVHAAALAADGARVRLMIGLEMIGYFSDEPRSQRFPAPGFGLVYPRVGNFIAVVGKVGQGAMVRRVRSAMRAAVPLAVESIAAPAPRRRPLRPPELLGSRLGRRRACWRSRTAGRR